MSDETSLPQANHLQADHKVIPQHSSRVESILYGEDAPTRDQARAELIRSGSAQELLEMSIALSSTLDTTRRRATRLLSDIQPHRARPALIQWLNQLEKKRWQPDDSTSTKALTEGVAHAARLLNQLTVRGEGEECLFQIYHSGLIKAQRACICPAAPIKVLGLALGHQDQKLVASALTEILRRLDQIEITNLSERNELSQILKQGYPIEQYEHLESSTAETLRLWTRLFAHLYPEVEQWISIQKLYEQDLLLLYNQVDPLLEALQQFCAKHNQQDLNEDSNRYILALLSAIEQRLRVQAPKQESQQQESQQQQALILDSSTTELLQSSPWPQIRSILARLLPASASELNTLSHDDDLNVRWCAQRAQRGQFNPVAIRDRLGAHQRLSLPSAKPPYGLRAFDKVPQIKRVKAAVALCQARFDVNLGVAMRSAEAAGLQEVFVIGARSGSLTSARGAEHAIPVHWLPDAHSLISVARQAGYQLVAVQQTPDSEAYHQADYPPQPLFVLGSEDSGLPDALRLAADLAVEIPLFGAIDSLNVATAATCVMMHWRAHLDHI